MKPYPTDVTQLVQKDGGPLVCHGCAHSAGGRPYPGFPSGERPCCFCIRNVQLNEMIADARQNLPDMGAHFSEQAYGKTFTPRYDNGPVEKLPLDCYIATDYLVHVVSKIDK